jgi:hypothetical protein
MKCKLSSRLDLPLFSGDHNTCLYPCQDFFARQKTKNLHFPATAERQKILDHSLYDAKIMPTSYCTFKLLNLKIFSLSIPVSPS